MKVPQLIRSLSLLFIIILIFSLIYKTKNIIRNQENDLVQIQSLPAFEFSELNGNTFTKKNLITGKPIIIIWFDLSCDHCNFEIEDILNNIRLFNNISVLLVSDVKEEVISGFSKKTGLDTIHQVKLLKTNYDYFTSKFNKPALPTTYIYNDEHKLIKIFRGEVGANAIISAVKTTLTPVQSESAKN